MMGTTRRAKGPPKRLAPLSRAAEHLAVSVDTIRKYITDGRLTGYRLGPRELRVDMDEVEALPKAVPRPTRNAS